ncbi:small ribosomal subunit protein mS38 [Pseudophryne corroboree]|uniref:small ribosomal subunit protein mS38 n=1 Tax=Pseudophryne corroboree TaxID=495146 RepID=UPI003081C173
MWLTRLTSHFCKATRLAGCLPWCVTTSHKSLYACYSTRQPQGPEIPPPAWCTLDPKLDDFLVPRMMSISPLESLLSSRFSLPKPEASNTQEEPVENERTYECPTHQDIDHTGEDIGQRDVMQCKNVLKIRRRKMNRHKYKKLQKRIKYLRRKIMDKRRVRKQKEFERDLKRIWRGSGLKKAPDGWIMPKIYVKH